MRCEPYKPYSREFKLEAVRLAEAGDKTGVNGAGFTFQPEKVIPVLFS